MKNIVILFGLIFCFASGHESIKLVRIRVADRHEIADLGKAGISILDAGAGLVRALVKEGQLSRLAGYDYEVLIDDYQAYKDDLFKRGFYHTYNQVYLVLDSLATNYPDLCRLDTIGFSIQGRAIWAMRVTDNPQIEENEAEIRLAGNMHGDEHIGTEITLYFLRYLLTNYAANPAAHNLVDNREIWILPTLNPDGKVANERWNANGVDLNRDYGYFWDGWGNSPSPNSQIENKAMIQHLDSNNISLEYNYHSDANVVNYPWDYHQSDPPDSQYIVYLSDVYGDSTGLPIINGWDWYQVNGSLQDYTIGISGALAWTIETSEPGGSSAIDQICYDNRDALMDLCDRAAWGIEGVVKDTLTQTPLHARIEVTDPERIDIYSDPVLGDFHKMVQPGTYDLKVTANGYAPRAINDVIVPSTGSAALGDIYLVSDSSYRYAWRVVLCRYASHSEQNNKTQPRFGLGQPDNRFFSLGRNGYIVLDMGSATPIIDIPGDDFTVYEGNDGAAEGYTVYASNDWTGSWSSCGSGSGTTSFELSASGLSQARYLRIVDDGSSTSGQYAGFDLDAVEFYPQTGIREACSKIAAVSDLSVSPNPFTETVEIRFQAGRPDPLARIMIYDACGCLVRDFPSLTSGTMVTASVVWDGSDDSGNRLPGGVYFVRLLRETDKAITKVIKSR